MTILLCINSANTLTGKVLVLSIIINIKVTFHITLLFNKLRISYIKFYQVLIIFFH